MKLTNTHLLILIAIVFAYFFFFKKDTFQNVSPEINQQIDQIYDYIMNNDPKYTNYLDFLISIHNTNLELINAEVFSLFKGAKKRNMFTKEMILEEMKLSS
jgi:ABC-type dipeptide/oligopeptide/nickel transport system permease component